mmetsp:Transcript_10501/g.9048  ORF Transcript_10501/g.9048 Transcript_10501/m.9048 type:complete len:81 (+) Transcript_10501:823-1065(+)
MVELHDDTDYKTEKVKNDICVKYKLKSNDVATIKVEMTLKVPLFNLIVLLYEVEAHPMWVPFCTGGQKLQNVDRVTFSLL